MSYLILTLKLLFDLRRDSIWLDVWDGLIKWVYRHEMSHVSQKFTIKLHVFFEAFVCNFHGL